MYNEGEEVRMEAKRKNQETALLTINEAAEVFGVSRIKLYRWMKAGRLEWFKSGRDEREKLVRREDVQSLIDPRSVTNG